MIGVRDFCPLIWLKMCTASPPFVTHSSSNGMQTTLRFHISEEGKYKKIGDWNFADLSLYVLFKKDVRKLSVKTERLLRISCLYDSRLMRCNTILVLRAHSFAPRAKRRYRPYQSHGCRLNLPVRLREVLAHTCLLAKSRKRRRYQSTRRY